MNGKPMTCPVCEGSGGALFMSEEAPEFQCDSCGGYKMGLDLALQVRGGGHGQGVWDLTHQQRTSLSERIRAQWDAQLAERINPDAASTSENAETDLFFVTSEVLEGLRSDGLRSSL